MSTGSKALDRKVAEWLAGISSGTLRLPSFQRGIAWDRRRVASMLDTILNDLPLGITLVLDVGDEEKFHSRPLESAPNTPTKVTEHLLDGQQRLTALWRALKDNNERETYFIHVPELDDDPDNDDMKWSVRAVPTSVNEEGVRYPRWADDPADCLRQGLIPVRLLDPEFEGAGAWVDEATHALGPDESIADFGDFKAALERVTSVRQKLKERIILPFRETLRHYNLPYLRLPATTPRDVALSVFVNMNTNAKPLRPYDIVVAEMEDATGQRLRELVATFKVEHPGVPRYMQVEDAVLQTASLMQGRAPNQKGIYDLDLQLFADEWTLVGEGLDRAVRLLEEINLFDAERIPTVVPLPVMAALLSRAAVLGDGRAEADRLMRRYLWTAFFTSRYEKAAATRAVADYRALRQVMAGSGLEEHVPLFDSELYPLPDLGTLTRASWPKSKRTLSRAILAASNYFGARDFADDTLVTRENVVKREYHHIFPDKLLKDANIESSLALNCALITWYTNRTIGRMDPIAYLNARAERAPDPANVPGRLASHLVPFHELASAGPYPQPAGEELRRAVLPDFEAFLEARASWVSRAMVELCAGRQPHLSDIAVLVASNSGLEH